MVFPHVLYCHCILPGRSICIAYDMVAPENITSLENWIDDRYSYDQLVFVSINYEIPGLSQRVLQSHGCALNYIFLHYMAGPLHDAARIYVPVAQLDRATDF